jgi:hypothetical protein
MASLTEDKANVRHELNNVLEILGQHGKRVTLLYLEQKQGIAVNDSTPISKEQAETALKALFGSGSELIIRQLERELCRT